MAKPAPPTATIVNTTRSAQRTRFERCGCRSELPEELAGRVAGRPGPDFGRTSTPGAVAGFAGSDPAGGDVGAVLVAPGSGVDSPGPGCCAGLPSLPVAGAAAATTKTFLQFLQRTLWPTASLGTGECVEH